MKPEKSLFDTQKSELRAHYRAELKELKEKGKVFSMLPPDRAPIVCNFCTPTPLEPRAWVHYTCPAYDPDDTFDPVVLLKALEERGWRLADSVSCVRWDDYRHSAEPCAVSVAANYTHPKHRVFKDGEDIAPYWVVPQQFTKAEFVAFMVGPDGLIYRVSVDSPKLPVSLGAKRVVTKYGDWSFVSGTAQIYCPAWQMHHLSKAFVDTQQGISGVIYFHKDNAEKLASMALAKLLKRSK